MSERKRKTGILTFHYANNYGAVLQTYALQTVLESLDAEREICVVDYRCDAAASRTGFYELALKKGYLKAALHYVPARRLAAKFDGFRARYLNLTVRYRHRQDLEEDLDQYDAFVSGSDQVWNPRWTGGDYFYMQDFHSGSAKKISYAASFGTERIREDMAEVFREFLQMFAGLSVRETSAVLAAQNQLGLTADRHMDPVLLLEAEKWKTMADRPRISEPYIFVYMVPYQQSVLDSAVRLGKETGLRVFVLTKKLVIFRASHVRAASPEEFIGWIQNAEYVVTNSFHGTVFSILFYKKMIVELFHEKGVNVRIRDLLDLFQISGQMSGDGRLMTITEYDRNVTELILEMERIRSKEYLSGMCGGAVD